MSVSLACVLVPYLDEVNKEFGSQDEKLQQTLHSLQRCEPVKDLKIHVYAMEFNTERFWLYKQWIDNALVCEHKFGLTFSTLPESASVPEIVKQALQKVDKDYVWFCPVGTTVHESFFTEIYPFLCKGINGIKALTFDPTFNVPDYIYYSFMLEQKAFCLVNDFASLILKPSIYEQYNFFNFVEKYRNVTERELSTALIEAFEAGGFNFNILNSYGKYSKADPSHINCFKNKRHFVNLYSAKLCLPQYAYSSQEQIQQMLTSFVFFCEHDFKYFEIYILSYINMLRKLDCCQTSQIKTLLCTNMCRLYPVVKQALVRTGHNNTKAQYLFNTGINSFTENATLSEAIQNQDVLAIVEKVANIKVTSAQRYIKTIVKDHISLLVVKDSLEGALWEQLHDRENLALALQEAQSENAQLALALQNARAGQSALSGQLGQSVQSYMVAQSTETDNLVGSQAGQASQASQSGVSVLVDSSEQAGQVGNLDQLAKSNSATSQSNDESDDEIDTTASTHAQNINPDSQETLTQNKSALQQDAGALGQEDGALDKESDALVKDADASGKDTSVLDKAAKVVKETEDSYYALSSQLSKLQQDVLAKPDIHLVSVVNNIPLYDKLFRHNPCTNQPNIHLHPIVNPDPKEPERIFGLAEAYNRFLDNFDYSKEAWLVFCHNDVEFLDDLNAKLKSLDKNYLYGPCGAYLRYDKQGQPQPVLLGSYIKQFPNFGLSLYCHFNLSFIKYPIDREKYLVDTLDCLCLVVHSSLIERYHLRFDEHLLFDLVTEEMCMNAKFNHNISSKLLDVLLIHHSDSDPFKLPPSYYGSLKYLNTKYPDAIMAGTGSMVGGAVPHDNYFIHF